MPYETILNYGAIGACLVYFMYDKIKYQVGLSKVIENNTIAVTKVYEIMNHCKKRRDK